MRIEPVEKEQAPETVRRIYDALEKQRGRPPGNLHKMLAHKPDVLRTFLPFYGAIWAPGALPDRLKELAYLRASILNGCAY